LPRAFLNALQQIERLPFDTLMSGNGDRHSVADLVRTRQYVEAMMSGVKSGIRSGRSMEQIQAALALDDFSQLPNVGAQRSRNIAEA
jgi:hypothetical protein